MTHPSAETEGVVNDEVGNEKRIYLIKENETKVNYEYEDSTEVERKKKMKQQILKATQLRKTMIISMKFVKVKM